MRKGWLIVLFFAYWHFGQAQTNYFFGHYMFNPSYFNPAWSGSEKQAFAAFQHRTQWLGYSSSFDGTGGAPSTQLLTAIVPIKNFFISSIGANVSNDNLGPVSNFQFQTPLTFTQRIDNAELNLGVAPGIFSQTQKFDELRFNDPSDPLRKGERETQTKMNLSAGIFYQTDKGLFLGVSAINLLRPGFDFGLDSLENKQEISYALHGGYTFKISDEIKFVPTLLIRSDLSGFTFDLGGILTLKEKMWGGLSYRRGESAILYLGYGLLENNQLKVGYSFDYVFQKQEAKAPTSHELFVRFDLPDIVIGGRKSVKTPRFTY